MAVAIVLKGQQDVRLVHWAARIAEGRGDDLVLFWATKRPAKKGPAKRTTSRNGVDEIPTELKASCEKMDIGPFRFRQHDQDENLKQGSEDRQLLLEVVSISSKRVHIELEREVDELGINCLIIPREPQLRSGSHDAELIDHMLGNVPCEIVLLTGGVEETGECGGIVTPVGEGPHSASCLRMANDIARVSSAKLIALHVEPEVDETAEQAAKSILAQAVERALGDDQQNVKQRVVLNNDVVEGIKETLDESPNLIILGMKRAGIVQRFSSQGIAEKLVNANPGPAIAIVQSAIPLTSRVGRRLEEMLQSNVPQLQRDRRVQLVERIQRSSQWDFDFVALIFMSTLIAAGGLIQDSAAVVIGAMLVAPLMTPLLGTGLSITQGNVILFRSTLMTVLRGFLLAFVTSFIVGMCAADGLTDEMLARGNPRPLDILVAAVGGIAAAYASGRPNLLSALPGVAIAASLVPPIATSGIALYLGEVGLCVRAAALFFTNIVAIILGTWIAFRAVGIRSTHSHGDFNRWTLGAGGALLALVVLLGVFESQLGRGGAEDIVQKQLNKLAQQHQWSCTDVEYQFADGIRVLNVHIESTEQMTPEREQIIRKSISDSFDNPPPVKFITSVMRPQ